MGKFSESGREVAALAVQPAETPAQIAAGYDDDGGADTPLDADSQILTIANSNQIAINPVGSQRLPQLKEAVLRTTVAIKISNLLTANGYSKESARMIEAAAKDLPGRVETLPPGSAALAIGALDLTGQYSVKQIAIFEHGGYVITISAKDDGGYDEAAEPLIPQGLLDGSGRAEVGATRFTLADGIYSAGLRGGAPDPVVREAIQLLSRLTDLKSPLQVDELFRVLYESDFRDKARSTGKVVYAGLRGGPLMVDCYAFEGSDGYFRCFDPRGGGQPVSLRNSTTSVGGILAPIKGAPVTALFGINFHPVLHILRLHTGIDFAAPVDSPVRAVADGMVELAGPAAGFGNQVQILHAGFETSYSHLSRIPESYQTWS